MKELGYVGAALATASKSADEGFSPGQINRNRSRVFVEALASEFRRRAHVNVRVLSKHCTDHRLEFGLNELLYDVLVCETATIAAAKQSAALTYVTRALWQIESEFAADTREALFDFNKLVIGSAPNKLFIGPRVDDELAFLGTHHRAATCCPGQVYAALVPHPRRWREPHLDVTYWSSRATGWASVYPGD